MPAIPRRLALAGLLACAAPPTLVAAPAPVELAKGERAPLPELAFQGLDGNPATLADFKGRVVVLNLWATWCAPCREEMPALDRLQGLFPKEEVLVLALSLDRGDANEKVTTFIREIGANRLALYRDPKAGAARTLKVPGLPATLLVDRAGREAARRLGIAVWDSPEVVAAVKTLLAEPAA